MNNAHASQGSEACEKRVLDTTQPTQGFQGAEMVGFLHTISAHGNPCMVQAEGSILGCFICV